MGPGIFLIAIMGCGEGDAPCQQVKTLETRFESRAACAAATEAAVTRNSDVDFPVVVAQCVAAGAAPSPPKAGEIQRPGPGRCTSFALGAFDFVPAATHSAATTGYSMSVFWETAASVAALHAAWLSYRASSVRTCWHGASPSPQPMIAIMKMPGPMII